MDNLQKQWCHVYINQILVPSITKYADVMTKGTSAIKKGLSVGNGAFEYKIHFTVLQKRFNNCT